jgi:hypothetical protein
VESIKLYRRHILFIPETDFHREASKYLQSQLNRFETAYYNAVGEKINNYGGPDDTTKNAKGRLHEAFSTSVAFLRDNSLLELDANLSRQVNDGVHKIIPERHLWRGTVLHFKDIDIDSLVEQIGTFPLLLLIEFAADISFSIYWYFRCLHP